MKILLVEPNYEREFLPLGLMKIARYHKNLGDEIKYINGQAGISKIENVQKVYITSLFTWDYKIVEETVSSFLHLYYDAEVLLGGICATLLYEKFVEKFKKQIAEGKLYIHKGLYPEFEEQLPYYEPFPKTDYFIGFTTRGCPNKCGFCMVHKHEPEYTESKDFLKNIIDVEIMHEKTKIILWDNNFLASSQEHFENVCDELYIKFGKRFKFDFNQAIDARLMTQEKANFLSKVNFEVIRFAFDGMHEDKFVQNAIKFIRNAGITSEIRNYVLYNFKDTPQDFYYRLAENAKLFVVSFPMKYQPLNVEEKGEFIGENWRKEWIENFNKLRSSLYMNGVIVCNENTPKNDRSYSLDNFYKTFGKDAEEFMYKLKNPSKNKIIEINQESIKNNKLNKYFGGN